MTLGLETFRQTLEVFEKFLSSVPTPVHIHFLTLIPLLLPLLASDKASVSLPFSSACSPPQWLRQTAAYVYKRHSSSQRPRDTLHHATSFVLVGARNLPQLQLQHVGSGKCWPTIHQCHREKIEVDGACLRVERRMTQPSVAIAPSSSIDAGSLSYLVAALMSPSPRQGSLSCSLFLRLIKRRYKYLFSLLLSFNKTWLKISLSFNLGLLRI